MPVWEFNSSVKRILVLSAYDAASHRFWRELVSASLPQFEWVHVALSAQHFSWRTRGNSFIFAYQHRQQLAQDYDLILATSMVDLSSLRGFLPKLAQIPTIIYFHENQFVYPISNRQPNILNVQLTSIYTLLCADKVVFNSNYNLETFFDGAATLLKQMPERLPVSIVKDFRQLAQVIPVPINLSPSPRKIESPLQRPIQILWNHRWEYDKRPEVFFAAIDKLFASGIDFRLHVVGQSFEHSPACFDNAKARLQSKIGTWGYVERLQYEALLNSCDIVISSALHDFQGLSMLEAINGGCIPVAPKRVAYPEYIPLKYLYDTHQDTQVEAENLFTKLLDIISQPALSPVSVEGYRTNELIPKYLNLIQQTIN